MKDEPIKESQITKYFDGVVGRRVGRVDAPNESERPCKRFTIIILIITICVAFSATPSDSWWNPSSGEVLAGILVWVTTCSFIVYMAKSDEYDKKMKAYKKSVKDETNRMLDTKEREKKIKKRREELRKRERDIKEYVKKCGAKELSEEQLRRLVIIEAPHSVRWEEVNHDIKRGFVRHNAIHRMMEFPDPEPSHSPDIK